ncbi:MAG: type II toxin-antitoxin system RelE/ParE family toxin [Opitutaceae bacterium]
MKPAIFHPEADDEFAAAIGYYARQREGLGDRFYEEIRQLTAEIETAPQLQRLWSMAPGGTLLEAFPTR